MTDIDKAVHTVMEFNPLGLCGEERIGEYSVFYHENRLYSIRAAFSGAVILITADSPFQAVSKVRGIFESD